MLRSSYKIGEVLGIPIKLHVSLVLVVFLLMMRFGPVSGLLMELGLVLSIVLHELGHSVVAIHKGCRVREITLMCIGGAAQMSSIPTRPLDELLMALAGPAVSLVIGYACVSIGPYIPLPNVRGYPINVVQLIGWTNFVLVVFNLLPSFPMDGGRVLRAALTPKLGRLRATFIAARLGKIMAVLFGIYGFRTDNWILVFIAFFVFIAAGNEYRMVQIQEAAKRGGFGPWDIFGGGEPPDEPDDDDKVIISPPPYEKGRGSKTRIHHS